MFWLHPISSQQSGVPNVERDLQRRSLLLKFVFDKRGKRAAWWNSWVLEFAWLTWEAAPLHSWRGNVRRFLKCIFEAIQMGLLSWKYTNTQLGWITRNKLELWEDHCIQENDLLFPLHDSFNPKNMQNYVQEQVTQYCFKHIKWWDWKGPGGPSFFACGYSGKLCFECMRRIILIIG